MTDTHVFLKSDRLTVELQPPGIPYQGARYDWSGIISQVTLDNTHTFLSGEHYADGSHGMGGRGLTGIFSWDDDSLYDAASLGDLFPMLGIGLVKKGDTQPFLFTKPYAVATPYPRVSEVFEDRCVIQTRPLLCSGIAVEQTKEISLSGSTITIRAALRNVGTRSVRAAECNHNFFRFDGHPVDNSYQLRLPFQVSSKIRQGQFGIGYDTIQPLAFAPDTQAASVWINGYEDLQSHWMQLENTETRTGVLVEDRFPPCRFYLWSNSAAFCPEVSCRIHLEPGESMEYERRYTFYTL